MLMVAVVDELFRNVVVGTTIIVNLFASTHIPKRIFLKLLFFNDVNTDEVETSFMTQVETECNKCPKGCVLGV